MADTNQPTSTSLRIPVSDIAKAELARLFPHLTAEQVTAIQNSMPVPPSPDWVNASGVGVSKDYINTISNAETQRQLDEAKELLVHLTRKSILLEEMNKAMMSRPLVTAILVFGNELRIRRARKAVNQFVSQSYPNKQLVIVNTTETKVATVWHKDLRELKVSSTDYPTLGMLRNLAIDKSDGELLYPHWDDDDIYDPQMLALMVQHYVPQKAVVLPTQVRVNIRDSIAYLHHEPDGIPNTMLVPKTEERYVNQTGGEDVEFWYRCWSRNNVVVDSTNVVMSTLKMCVFDGNNVLSEAAFMVDNTDHALSGSWKLPPDVAEHMRRVLATFGVRAEPKVAV